MGRCDLGCALSLDGDWRATGWSQMTWLRTPGSSFSGSFTLQQPNPGVHCGRAPEKLTERCEVSAAQTLSSTVLFCQILLGSVSHKATLDSESGETDSISDERSFKVTLQRKFFKERNGGHLKKKSICPQTHMCKNPNVYVKLWKFHSVI